MCYVIATGGALQFKKAPGFVFMKMVSMRRERERERERERACAR